MKSSFFDKIYAQTLSKTNQGKKRLNKIRDEEGEDIIADSNETQKII